MAIDDTDGVPAIGAGPGMDGSGRQRPWQLGERARRHLLAGAARRRLAGGAAAGAGDDGRDRADLHAVLVAAIREDTAASLGRAGRKLQAAVAALAAIDARRGRGGAAAVLAARREQCAVEAADALFACVVQREALGLVDHRMLNETYRVPGELWRRMSATVRRPQDRPATGAAPEPEPGPR